MFLCVLFLFEGEKILKAIFNIKSNAGSLGDLAASGAIMFGVAKQMGGVFSKSSDDVGNKYDKADAKAATTRIDKRRNKAKEDNDIATRAIEEKEKNGESTVSHGEYQGEEREPKEKSFDSENARDTLLSSSMKRRLKAGLPTKAINFAAGTVGATLSATQALSDGETNIGEALGSISVGKALGQSFVKPITGLTNKLEQRRTGKQMYNKIMSGEMDEELGINNISAISNGEAHDIMNTEEYEKRMESQQEIYRKALAEYARAAATGGKAKAEIQYYDYLEKNLKKN